MAIAPYYKIDGHWTGVERPYVKKNGVWTPVMEAWVKESGTWKMGYEYDVIPPNPPEITLEIVEDFDVVKNVKTLQSRWIKVGVRLPGGSNDADAKLARVLTNYAGAKPTTPLGGTYTESPDNTYPNEPWSDWRFNEFGAHKDTSQYAYKQWPRNASGGVIITGDKDYYFGGWSLDRNGNWSIATQAQIHVPKSSVNVPNVVVKEARFQPNTSGSWTKTGFAPGDLIQQGTPRSQGHFFYGSQFIDSVGAQGTPTVRSAQINLIRGDDSGAASANVYLFWTDYGSVAALPAPPGQLVTHEATKVGTIAKGQSKWFDLPEAFNNNLNSGIKGIGLDNKDPVKASAFADDYSQVVSTAANLRCGEVHIVWEEEL